MRADSVTAWGGEAIVTAQLSDLFGITLDYAHSEVETAGSNQQVTDIPRDLAKLLLTAQAPGGRFGGTASMNWVGSVFDSVGGGIGRVQHGNYLVADLAVWVFLDKMERHRVGVRPENAFDADYDTRIIRVRRDRDGTSYPVGTRGTPMTLHATYQLRL